MKSLILSTASRYLLPMLLLFSAFLLLRGHNLPGGGFSGGLVAAAGFTLYGFGVGMREARRLLRVSPATLIGTGLLMALASGAAALLVGEPFMTGQWGSLAVGETEGVKVGTPLLFDVAVFLVVIGSTLAVILTLGEED